MRFIESIGNLKGRTALVRADFNVPVGADGVVDDSEDIRIEKSLKTIKFLSKNGSKVILISHIGKDGKSSLRPVADKLRTFLPVTFVPVVYGEDVLGIAENLAEGEVILLENLRSNSGEESNSREFSAYLASLADFYVNEAFSVSHRSHASIVGVTEFLPAYVGFWFKKEIENLTKLDFPEKPFVFILGGAKFDTKIPLIKKFTKIASTIFIGGALANNFFKKIGFETGKSLLDEKINVTSLFQEPSIQIPFDVIVKTGEVKELNTVNKEDVIVDVGPATVAELKKNISEAKTVLWNGPLGLYEEGFDASSKDILRAISEKKCFSVVGGGDTVKLLKSMNLQDKMTFVSTGGGAMLEYLSNGTMVGIEALDQNEKSLV